MTSIRKRNEKHKQDVLAKQKCCSNLYVFSKAVLWRTLGGSEKNKINELCVWSFVLRVHKIMDVEPCFALACPHPGKIKLESSSLRIREEFSLHGPLIVGICT